MAAGVQPPTQLLRGSVHRSRVTVRAQHLGTQGLHIAGECVKRARVARRGAHAQPQFGCKTGGKNLARAVGDRIQHRVLPGCGAIHRGLAQQLFDPLQLGGVDGGQPLGVKGAWQGQRKQLGGVQCFRCVWQQLVAQALGQLAQKSRAGRKTKVGQKGGHVHGGQQHLPPRAQALLYVGPRLNRIQQQLQAAHGGLRRRLFAANPGAQADQPQVAFGQRCMRVQLVEQAAQIGMACLQWSTRAVGWLPVMPLSASSTNREIVVSKRCASSATQK